MTKLWLIKHDSLYSSNDLKTDSARVLPVFDFPALVCKKMKSSEVVMLKNTKEQ